MHINNEVENVSMPHRIHMLLFVRNLGHYVIHNFMEVMSPKVNNNIDTLFSRIK